MTKVKATGILRHHFHGEYYATLGLQFVDSASAGDALRTSRTSRLFGDRRA